MKNYNSNSPRFQDWEAWCFVLVIILLLIISFSGCSKKVYFPVETIRTETNIRDRFLRDSIYVHDSTYVKQRGDTVLIERWHTRWRERLFTDTCYIQKTDSVAVPYPVEKQLSKWSRLKLSYGGSAMILVILIILVGAGWMIYKLKK